MKTRIKLNQALQPFAGNRETVEVKGDTVKECLDSLISSYPIFREILFDAEGTLSALVLVNGMTIIPNDLNRPVSKPREILLLPIIQGG
jgi:molybdopterin converting factor small subunit